MVNLRTFIISDELFSGFECAVDLDEVDTIEEIIAIVINKLSILFKNVKLEILSDKISKTNFHIHDFSFTEILLNDDIYYICNHCNEDVEFTPLDGHAKES